MEGRLSLLVILTGIFISVLYDSDSASEYSISEYLVSGIRVGGAGE